MTPVQHMTLVEHLNELARFLDVARKASLGPMGHVTKDASYHAYLSDAATRAASHMAGCSKKALESQ